jgi:phosphopantetheinyl transferase
VWCGKEAVGKALGLGLPGGPGDLRAVAIDTAGTVTFAAAPGLSAARDMPDFVARTAKEDGLVVASAIIERG